MAEAKRDGNFITTLLAVSNADGATPTLVYADPSTNRLLVSATTDIGVAEDSVHASGATGVMMLAVRQDAQSDLGADGDYVPFSIDADGALRVSGGGGGTEYSEDAATPATIVGGAILMERDDALSAVTPIEGDWIGLRGSANGALWVAVDGEVTVTGVATAANQTTLLGYVDGIEGLLTTIDADTGGILTAVQLIDDAIVADDAAFTPATTKVMMAGYEFDDTTPDSVDEGDAGAARMSSRREVYTQIRDAAGNERGVKVDEFNQLAVVDGAVLTAVQIMDDWDNGASDGASVSGDVAHDAADAGEPVKIGGKAQTAPETAVADNDRVNAMFDTWGRLIAMAGLREMKGSQITTITSSTTETTIVTADATYKLDMYGIIVVNTSATATEVAIKDSTAGTTRFQISVPAGDMRGFMLPMDAGHIQAAVNNNWTATCADSVASIIITALFVKNL